MNKDRWERIPLLPLSALIFYISVFVLWSFGIIPSPTGILSFLEGLYESYGLFGLFIASFLEGIVYFGLYFPGSFIIALAVILSDGTFIELIKISLIVAVALTITSTINYTLGLNISKRKNLENLGGKNLSRGVLASMWHPNALAFYFFHSGIKNQNFLKILFVPIAMVPYGFLLALLIYSLKGFLKGAIESPYIMITAITIWFFIALILRNKNKNFESFDKK